MILKYLFLILTNFKFSNSLVGYYIVNKDVGLGRTFDGVGAISGGGATSKLLTEYPDDQREDILKFLFKPNFGASIQILKVEIGGDGQSSEGSESSHMHNEWDVNLKVGYEWWIMTQAKKFNPDIKLCGLPWSFPGWLGNGSWTPYSNLEKTVNYIVTWVEGMRNQFNLTIDCIGIHNEKPYNKDYIILLRSKLNEMGFSKVKIVAADQLPGAAWSIVDQMTVYEDLYQAVDVVGVHYNGREGPKKALDLGKNLWSSEDWSGHPDQEGGRSLARLLNRNYVDCLFSSTIVWNMACGYYDNLMYDRVGLLRANRPWSGFYEIGAPIWAMAHTTQFTNVGWKYLKHGFGVGQLVGGGSFVTIINNGGKNQEERKKKKKNNNSDNFVTIIIETITSPSFKVFNETANFKLQGTISNNISHFYLWKSKFSNNDQSLLFQYKGVIPLENGSVLSLPLEVDCLYTLTTVSTGNKGSSFYPIPDDEDFPKHFKDSYEGYEEFEEAFGFTQQVGSFEVVSLETSTNRSKVLKQVVLKAPVHWCPFMQSTPIGVIGNYNWSDVEIEVEAMIPSLNGSRGVFVGSRVAMGSCFSLISPGLFLFLSYFSQSLSLYLDLSRATLIGQKPFKVEKDQWYRLKLSIEGNDVKAEVEKLEKNHQTKEQRIMRDEKKEKYEEKEGIETKHEVINLSSSSLLKYSSILSHHGFVAMGTENFGLGYFDNLEIKAY